MNDRHGTTDGQALGVAVYGFSRSGTSAAAGVFVAAGFSAGNDADLMPPTSANPAGYNENMIVFRLNEDVLAELDANWFIPPDDEVQMKARDTIQPRLTSVLQTLVDTASPAPLVLKDPRLVTLQQLWGPALDGVLHPVVVIRDPVEIAHSLHRRDGTPVPLALASWEIHTSMLLRYFNGSTITVCRYEELLVSPQTATAIVEAARRHLTRDLAARVHPERASELLESGLRHNNSTDADHPDYLTLRQQRLWQTLSALPSGDCTLDVPAELFMTSQAAVAVARDEVERVRALRDTQEAAEAARTAYALAQAHIHNLEGVQEALEQIQEAYEQAQVHIGNLTAHANHLQSSVEHLQHELENQRQRLGEAIARADAREWAVASYETVVNSRSWRMTAPARALARAVRTILSRRRTAREPVVRSDTD